jgi:hypothetical protein
MKKHQVDFVPLGTDAQAFLSGHKSKVIAEFEKKSLQLLNQGVLQV